MYAMVEERRRLGMPPTMKKPPAFHGRHRSGGNACGGSVTSRAAKPSNRGISLNPPRHCENNGFDSSWFRKNWSVIEGDKITEFALDR